MPHVFLRMQDWFFRGWVRACSAFGPLLSRRWISVLAVLVLCTGLPLIVRASPESDVCTTLTHFDVLGCFNFLMAGIVHLMTTILLFLLDIFIGVTQYNHFADAPFVVAGWIIVRDVVNMFFIVILLVSAFATIIQYHTSEFGYDKVLPKLLLYAILINFSKTFLMLGVDFSQVIMLTFVNAFKDAAAGNFIVGFGLQQLITSANNNNAGSMISIIVTWFLALMLIAIMIMVVIAMIIFVLLRIMGLWILLTLSPAAFFASALPGKLQKALNTFTGDFWSKYNAFLTGGPIMAFFLYLTLATIQKAASDSQGDLGRATNLFTANNTTGVVGNVISQFSSSTLATFFFAITMMLLGLQAGADASKAIGGAGAAAISGIASSAKSGVSRVARGVALAPVAAGALALRGTGAAIVGAGRAGAGIARYTGKKVNEELDVTGRAGRLGMKIPIVRSAFRGTLAGLATGQRAETQKNAEDLLKQTSGMNIREKMDFMNGLAGSAITRTPAERLAFQRIQSDLALDSDYKKEREKDLQKDERIKAGLGKIGGLLKGGATAAADKLGGAYGALRESGRTYDTEVANATGKYNEGLVAAHKDYRDGKMTADEFAQKKASLGAVKDKAINKAKADFKERGGAGKAALGALAKAVNAGPTGGGRFRAMGAALQKEADADKAYSATKLSLKKDLDAKIEKTKGDGSAYDKRYKQIYNDNKSGKLSDAEAKMMQDENFDQMQALLKPIQAEYDNGMKAAKEKYVNDSGDLNGRLVRGVTGAPGNAVAAVKGAVASVKMAVSNVQSSLDAGVTQEVKNSVSGQIKSEQKAILDEAYKTATSEKYGDNAMSKKIKDVWTKSPELVLDKKELEKIADKIRGDKKLQAALSGDSLRDPAFVTKLVGAKNLTSTDKAEMNRVIDSLSDKIRDTVKKTADRLASNPEQVTQYA